MIEKIDVQKIADLPTADIARWATKIDRVDYALRENLHIDRDDVQAKYMLAEKNMIDKDWPEDSLFEDAVVYELKPEVTLGTLVEVDRPFQEYEGENVHARRARTVGRRALETALSRIGIIELGPEGKVIDVSLAGFAALCLKRADIREPIDRQLFEREDEIKSKKKLILAASRARATICHLPAAPGREETTYPMSLYSLAAYNSPAEVQSIKGANFDFDSAVPLWWQELYHDLERIDIAAASLD